MALSPFDEADIDASAAIGEMFEEKVVWHPMLKRAGGGMTGGGWVIDPNRPVRDLMAIVSWKPEILMAGENKEQGGMVSADCLVDIDRRDLQIVDETGAVTEGDPVLKGDIFELTRAYMGNTRVQVDRLGDDGSARIVFACNFPE